VESPSTPALLRIVLFEDVWDLILHPPAPSLELDAALIAKIQAAPSDRHLGPARRAVRCTSQEARQLLRVFTDAADLCRVIEDDRRLRLASAGCGSVVQALLGAETQGPR
jgi:hypothetical protein